MTDLRLYKKISDGMLCVKQTSPEQPNTFEQKQRHFITNLSQNLSFTVTLLSAISKFSSIGKFADMSH